MCRRAEANAKIVTVFNMMLATVISTAVGGMLGLFGLPYWLVGGSVATVAVVSEHYLTLYLYLIHISEPTSRS